MARRYDQKYIYLYTMVNKGFYHTSICLYDVFSCFFSPCLIPRLELLH